MQVLREAVDLPGAPFQWLERFGATDCHALTGCGQSIPEERDRFYRDQVYRDSCLPQLEYALSYCLDQIERIAAIDAPQVGRSGE